MKTTSDLFEAFSKGSEYFTVTAKQANWLFSLADKEGLIKAEFGDSKYITIDGKKYRFGKTYIPMGCYGGGIGRKKASHKWNVEPSESN